MTFVKVIIVEGDRYTNLRIRTFLVDVTKEEAEDELNDVIEIAKAKVQDITGKYGIGCIVRMAKNSVIEI
jgi:hypothetical protein